MESFIHVIPSSRVIFQIWHIKPYSLLNFTRGMRKQILFP